MLRAGAASPARGGQVAEDTGAPAGGGEERPGRQPPAAAPRLPDSKPQGGSEDRRTPDRDLQRGRLSRSPRTAPPAPGMGDRGAQHERAALQSPGGPEGAAAAVNGLLHNGFHPPPPACSRDPPPARFQLLSELQPQPLFSQHDSPAKKCRLRRRMDSGRKNRPRKSRREGTAVPAVEGAAKHPLGTASSLEALSAEGGGPRWCLASPIRLTLTVAGPSVIVEKRRTLCPPLLVARCMHPTDLGSRTRDRAGWHSSGSLLPSPSISFGVCSSGYQACPLNRRVTASILGRLASLSLEAWSLTIPQNHSLLNSVSTTASETACVEGNTH